MEKLEIDSDYVYGYLSNTKVIYTIIGEFNETLILTEISENAGQKVFSRL